MNDEDDFPEFLLERLHRRCGTLKRHPSICKPEATEESFCENLDYGMFLQPGTYACRSPNEADKLVSERVSHSCARKYHGQFY